uniref:Helicase ATP-binding domain-containing protein n=1 Tax=Spongospora subterranea TaxID=70186 RepID=A0A0H5R6W0_9EUKA|eukprot:CRZ09865.1 hypothetical protein [Spongospora subterranea]
MQFPFPFAEPYDCQIEFMTALYEALEAGRHGIFESPTGTGKSLSIICAALHWLQNQEKKQSGDETQDWVKDFADKQRQEEYQLVEEKRKRIVKKAEQSRAKFVKRRLDRSVDSDDSELIVDFEVETREKSVEEWINCLKDSDSDDDHDQTDREHPIQVIYATRTHSQIRQFMHEFIKTPFYSQCSCVPLSSRAHLCVHDTIRFLKPSLINDACLDMISTTASKGAKKSRCEFLTPSLQKIMAAYSLQHPSDLEDIQKKGVDLRACSYFGSRLAAQTAQLLVVPYSAILSDTIRKSLGLNLKGNVVIVDEAHNLVEAVNDLYSASLSLANATKVRDALEKYLAKYHSRLKLSNTIQLKRTIFVVQALVRFLEQLNPSNPDRIMSVNDFTFEIQIDNQNLWEISTWIEGCSLVKKLVGFFEKFMKNEESVDKPMESLINFKAFFIALTNSDQDGRIIVKAETPSIRFMLLNPANAFSKITSEARCVILAGGTMQPYQFYSQQLFPGCPGNVGLFSCGHIVPPANVSAFIVASGPTKSNLTFTYSQRSLQTTLLELGRTLVNLVSIAPDGIVCFFPSYAYEAEVVLSLQENGFLDRIRARKVVFREPRESSDVQSTLDEYTLRIHSKSGKGAILFCVVGGKMSEGINFSDELARLVVVVGMPYANPNEFELQERMRYMDATHGQGSGEQYFETLCMRAVNQSIGRAIRHRADYAAIILLDERYRRPRVRQQIPSWLRNRIAEPASFGEAYGALAKFYRSHKES